MPVVVIRRSTRSEIQARASGSPRLRRPIPLTQKSCDCSTQEGCACVRRDHLSGVLGSANSRKGLERQAHRREVRAVACPLDFEPQHHPHARRVRRVRHWLHPVRIEIRIWDPITQAAVEVCIQTFDISEAAVNSPSRLKRPSARSVAHPWALSGHQPEGFCMFFHHPASTHHAFIPACGSLFARIFLRSSPERRSQIPQE